MVPTSAGREFLRHATAILESIENAKRDLCVLTGASAEVRIGVPLTVSRLVTSELYQLVRAQFPNIRLQNQRGVDPATSAVIFWTASWIVA